MGGWKLEVFKMAMYMSFPVGLFYYFNQPEFFEEWMLRSRGELFRVEDPNVRPQIVKAINKLERLKVKKLEEELKKQSGS